MHGFYRTDIRLAGTSYKKENLARVRELKNAWNEAEVIVRAEPDNPADKNAIAVDIKIAGEVLPVGYIPADIARLLHTFFILPVFPPTPPIVADCPRVTGGVPGKGNYGMIIRIKAATVPVARLLKGYDERMARIEEETDVYY